jgi:uncharacterized protein (DUF433 family)
LPEGQRVQIAIRPFEETPSETPPLDEPPAWLERLDVDPALAPGKLVIKGTRLLAEDLARLIEEGRNDEELQHLHPDLTPDDWDAVRCYARLPLALRRSFGAWAEDAEELDQFLEQRRAARRVHRQGREG